MMNRLVERLKVTTAKTTPGPKMPVASVKSSNAPAPQHKPVVLPMPSSIKVAPPTVAKAKFVPNTSGREAELIKAAVAVKHAEANVITENRFNDTMLENLRKEYADFVKKLMADMEETGPLYFTVKEEPKVEEPKPAEPVAVDNTVPQPLGNFGEIEPAPKKSRKKKAEA